jgi:hypothetical protein
MIEKENWNCIEGVLSSSKQVLHSSLSVFYESIDKRNELCDQIHTDYKQYKEGICGNFKPNFDRDVHSKFQMALLILAYIYKKHSEPSPPSMLFFSEKEFEAYDLLKKFNSHEIFTPSELREKLKSGDTYVANLLKDYNLMNKSINYILTHPEIRPVIRTYFKKQWDTYKQFIKSAIGPQEGQYIVTCAECQQSELNFINRIEHKLKVNKNQITFFGRTFNVDKIKRGIECNKKGKTFNYVDKNKIKSFNNLPQNQFIKARFIERKIAFGKKRSFIFYAVFASHVKRYIEDGFDSNPLTLKEINEYLIALIEQARNDNSHILLCIASPTGFENIDHFSSNAEFKNKFVSSHVSVCFLDLNKNKMQVNQNDQMSVELSKLCDLETKAEKYERIKKDLYPEMIHQLLVHQSVSLKFCEDFSTSNGYEDQKMIKKLFSDYAQQNRLSIKEIPSIGPVIMK